MVIYLGGIAPWRFDMLRCMAGCCQVVINEMLGFPDSVEVDYGLPPRD